MSSNSSAKLESIAKAVGELASQRFSAAIGKNVGEALLTELRYGFENSVAPDDAPWAPFKRGGKGRKLLLRTGRLRAGYSYQVLGSTLKFGTNVSYAKFHQLGTNGLRAAFSRHAPIDASGKFQSKFKSSKSGKTKVFQTTSIGIRTLNFQVGSGGIPARPMLPTTRSLPARWKAARDAAVLATRKEILGR